MEKTVVALGLAVAILSLQKRNRVVNPPSSFPTNQTLDYFRFCAKSSTVGFSVASKSHVLMEIVFSGTGTKDDIARIVSCIMVDFDCEGKQLVDSLQHRVHNICLKNGTEAEFCRVTTAYCKLWDMLYAATGTTFKRVPTCLKCMLASILNGLGLMCTELGNSFDLLEHYQIYERMGTWMQILRKLAQQLKQWCHQSTGSDAQAGEDIIEDASSDENVLLRTIASMVDKTSRFPLLTSQLHCLVLDLSDV